MNRVGVRELKQNASAVLRRVEDGETIEVTDRGRPVARLVPLVLTHRLDRLIEEGKASPSKDTLLSHLNQHPPLIPTPGEPLPSEILAELRADER
jgi:prevent-host-death family protein